MRPVGVHEFCSEPLCACSAARRCEITGGAGEKYPVVGAGVWHADDASKVRAHLRVESLGTSGSDVLAPNALAPKMLCTPSLLEVF